MGGGYPPRWPDGKIHHRGSSDVVEILLDIVGLRFIHRIFIPFPIGPKRCLNHVFTFPQSGTIDYSSCRPKGPRRIGLLRIPHALSFVLHRLSPTVPGPRLDGGIESSL